VKLVDATGNLVLEKETAEQLLSFDDLPAGIYFVVIENDTVVTRMKLVITR
jgi:hypothetical protein